jgi:hypothetical protein
LQRGQPAGDRESQPQPATGPVSSLFPLRERLEQLRGERLVEPDSGVSDSDDRDAFPPCERQLDGAARRSELDGVRQ